VGDPFTIGGKTWTPSDQLNYDSVGYASIAAVGSAGITAAHKTLPLPSYAEVTSLDSGRTILVRVERRGPMDNDRLVELSQDAARQLGMEPGSRLAVRLRRTNPPEQERAVLRQGGPVPERMETPEPLLKVLRRKLTEQSPLLPSVSAPASASTPSSAQPAKPPKVPAPPTLKSEPQRLTAPVGAKASQETPAAKGSLVVQVAAFSVEASARKVAEKLGGLVTRPGKYWLVRLGPFTNSAQAAPALEKARAAGYRDARIQRAD
jgi:rare lipoprotein A